MFYLRTVEDNIISNTCLGKSYWSVNKKDNPNEFNAIVKENGFNKDTIHKIVVGSCGTNFVIISKYKNYIVTENGNTYEKL